MSSLNKWYLEVVLICVLVLGDMFLNVKSIIEEYIKYLKTDITQGKGSIVYIYTDIERKEKKKKKNCDACLKLLIVSNGL